MRLACIFTILLSLFPCTVWSKACQWDDASLSYQGTALEQATCLLRAVSKGGTVADTEAPLPAHLATRIGQPVSIRRTALRHYLQAQGIQETSLGGSLDEPLSTTGGEPAHPALYFVIHDTSNILCTREEFPDDSDSPDANWNMAATWESSKQAHLFLARDGAAYSPQGRTFSVPWRATKHEMALGESTRGRFLHIENVQLRRPEVEADAPLTNAEGHCVNDRIAQRPGFTPKQMRLLALAYIAASIRAGEWMIPAYHAVIDASFAGGHDDPQNFDLVAWSEVIDAVASDIERISNPAAAFNRR
ncbi:MAG: hypothetical protein WAZ48_11560 [Lysobacteraceae bacterium]